MPLYIKRCGGCEADGPSDICMYLSVSGELLNPAPAPRPSKTFFPQFHKKHIHDTALLPNTRNTNKEKMQAHTYKPTKYILH
jgi:hypothetical protein